jgi:hypothetical protein
VEVAVAEVAAVAAAVVAEVAAVVVAVVAAVALGAGRLRLRAAAAVAV